MAMAPRGSEGYDFTPIITQPVFLVTSVLAVVSMIPVRPQQTTLTRVFLSRWAGLLLSLARL